MVARRLCCRYKNYHRSKWLSQSVQETFTFTEEDTIVPKSQVNEKKEDYNKPTNKDKNKEKLIELDYSKASLFELFILRLQQTYKEEDIIKKEVIKKFQLTPKQVDLWLAKGIEKEILIKKHRPVRYTLNPEVSIKKATLEEKK